MNIIHGRNAPLVEPKTHKIQGPSRKNDKDQHHIEKVLKKICGPSNKMIAQHFCNRVFHTKALQKVENAATRLEAKQVRDANRDNKSLTKNPTGKDSIESMTIRSSNCTDRQWRYSANCHHSKRHTRQPKVNKRHREDLLSRVEQW
jgi:hypothetical protein